jgi:hypothetical protein
VSVWSSRSFRAPARDDTLPEDGEWVLDVATAPGWSPHIRLSIWKADNAEEEDVCLYLTPQETHNLANWLGVAALAVQVSDPEPEDRQQ